MSVAPPTKFRERLVQLRGEHRPDVPLVAELTVAKLNTPWLEAALAITNRRFDAAAMIYSEIGALPDEAIARLQAGKHLIKEGRRAQGETQLEQSLSFWRRVGATAYIRRAEALLSRKATA
jgi:hypothetical protein